MLDFLRKPGSCQLGLRNDSRRALAHNRLRILILVLMSGLRERNQNSDFSIGCEFRQGTGPGPAHHEIRPQ